MTISDRLQGLSSAQLAHCIQSLLDCKEVMTKVQVFGFTRLGGGSEKLQLDSLVADVDDVLAEIKRRVG